MSEPTVALPPPGRAPEDIEDDGLIELRRIIHKSVLAVTEDLERFGFNPGRRTGP